MKNAKEKFVLSKFCNKFLQNVILYEGLYSIKMKESKISLEKLKKFNNSKEIISSIKILLNEYEKLPEIQKEIINGIFPKVIESFKNPLEMVDIYGKYLIDMADKHMKNLTYEKLEEFENINYLTFLFTEFDNYIFDTYKFLLLKHPDILKNRQISVQEVWEIKTPEIITEYIAEQVLHDIFYKNYFDIFDFAKNPLGLKHGIERQSVEYLEICKQIRNLKVHGDGTISPLFLKKIKRISPKFHIHITENYTIGQKYYITGKFVNGLMNFIFGLVKDIDKLLIESYLELIIN